jgi:hypothetical protein
MRAGTAICFEPSGMVRKRKKPAAAAQGSPAFDAEVSEAFRRARSSIGQITADLNDLRLRATKAVKPPHQPAKSK